MRRIYKTYFAPAYTETINNFFETSTYITWVSHDYSGKEEKFAGIEAFGMGQTYEIENGLGKYIKSKYMGLIENMGIIEAYFDENKNQFVIGNVEDIIGDNNLNDSYLSSKIKNCLMNQHIAYHSDNKLSWSKKIKWLFIQVKKVNLFENNLLYKQKEVQDIYTDFSEKGDIINSDIPKRYFRMYKDVYYDLETKHLFRGNKIVFLSSQAGIDKQKFIEYLINNQGVITNKELVIKNIGYEKFKGDKNKALLDLKRSLIENDFVKKLELKKIDVEQILYAERGGGYKITGEFVSELPPNFNE